MPLPEEVHRRLVARAVTDPDVASLLAMFTKPAETVSEPPLGEPCGVSQRPQMITKDEQF